MKNILPFLLFSTLISFSQNTLPDLPQEYVNTCEPTTTITKTVCSSGCDYLNTELQKAINEAVPGTKLVLQANSYYQDTYTFPEKNGTDWIVITTSAAESDLPSDKKRITPSYASKLPKFRAQLNTEAIRFDSRAHHYYFKGLEFLTKGFSYNIISIGNDETAIKDLPHHIVFDRVYIHGHATSGTRRGIMANGRHIGIVNSYISDCKESNADSQAIACWNGTSIKIANNYLEGAGENVMFGGADPSIPNLIPSDIEIIANHFHKPLTWFPNDPNYAGLKWCVKNLFELKNAKRVLIKGNVFENNWADCQNGFAVLFTPRNQGGTAPWSGVQHVTFTSNRFKNVASGINISGSDDLFQSIQTKHILILHNLVDKMDNSVLGGDGRLFQVLGGVDSCSINHNTCFNSNGSAFLMTDVANLPNTHFEFTNNIVAHTTYGAFGSGMGVGNSMLPTFFPGCSFTNNAIVGDSATWAASYPANNYFPPDYSYIKFQSLVSSIYYLTGFSPYKNKATDGTDIGAHMDSIIGITNAAWAGIFISCDPAAAINENLSFNLTFNLHPNPATNFITIENKSNKPVKMLLYSVNGKLIWDQTLDTEANLLDISNLTPGLYIVQLQTTDVSYSIFEKFVKVED